MARRAVCVGITLFAVLTVSAPAWAQPEDETTARDPDCLVCHTGVGEESAPKIDVARYRQSVHAGEGCVSCHVDIEDTSIHHEERDEDLAPATCGSCHEEEQRVWQRSVHADVAAARAANKPLAVCARCHGTHEIVAVGDPRSSVHPLQQPDTCGECHGPRDAAGHTFEVPAELLPLLRGQPAGPLQEALEHQRLPTVACASCHGGHLVLDPREADSTLGPSNVVATCGTCHAGPRRDYEESAHGRALVAGDTEEGRQAPVCVTCHHMHSAAIGPPRSTSFRRNLVHECGNCHEELYATFEQSYHGKATTLGEVAVAQCSDCHTPHRVLSPDDPRSSVSPSNKLETCRKCHHDAPPNFAGFWPHADPHDGERYPALHYIWLSMTILLASVFSFFGLHTLLWAIREAFEAVRLRGVPRPKHHGPVVERFALVHRITHLFVIISFLGLAATGAPLKFSTTGWAKVIFSIVGGVHAAGWWHRLFAIITFGYFSTHVFVMARALVRHWRAKTMKQALLGPDSLVPRWSDAVDVLRHFRWFLGLTPKPTWERWTYWEKFDYWAVFWGVAIIGGSGLFLWFPKVVTLVVPGWAINLALVVHSDEALMAIGFIFGVHFFNSHMRRTKFPMDPVMFTGTVPEEEYREERGLEWARMEADGRVSGRYGKAPTEQFLRWARVFGISAWLFGLLLLALIVHGVITE